MEDKQLKFERIAEKRVTEAIKRIRLIGNLSNKNNYSYNDAHIKQIIDALELELRTLKIKFKEGRSVNSCEFRFQK